MSVASGHAVCPDPPDHQARREEGDAHQPEENNLRQMFTGECNHRCSAIKPCDARRRGDRFGGIRRRLRCSDRLRYLRRRRLFDDWVDRCEAIVVRANRCGRAEEKESDKSGARGEVTRVRAAPLEQRQRGSQNGRHQHALPQQMHQGPTDGLGQRAAEDCRDRAHFAPPSRRSRRSRIALSSSALVFRPESACRTSLAADPPNARSARSRRSWRCVFCSL